LLGLLFDPDGEDMLLQNDGWLSMNYMVLYSRSQSSLKK
jgi:hypothetical protein